MKENKPCHREVGDCIEGHSIYVVCQKPSVWTLIRKSGQHRGWECTARKGAKAKLLKKYTNIK